MQPSNRRGPLSMLTLVLCLTFTASLLYILLLRRDPHGSRTERLHTLVKELQERLRLNALELQKLNAHSQQQQLCRNHHHQLKQDPKLNLHNDNHHHHTTTSNNEKDQISHEKDEINNQEDQVSHEKDEQTQAEDGRKVNVQTENANQMNSQAEDGRKVNSQTENANQMNSQTEDESQMNENQMNVVASRTRMMKKIPQRKDYKTEAPMLLVPPVETLARHRDFRGHSYGTLFSKRYDIIFALPTFPRFDEQGREKDYLRQTLKSLIREYEQSEARDKLNILFYVQGYHEESTSQQEQSTSQHEQQQKNNMDNRVEQQQRNNMDSKVEQHQQQKNSMLNQVKQEFAGNQLVFVHQSALRFHDPFEDIRGHNYKHFANTRPGPVARQQNCDVASMTEHVMRNFDFDFFFFLEDDYLACDGFFNKLYEALNVVKQKTGPGAMRLCALRVTYGMSGLLMTRFVLRQFISYVEENLDSLPIDLLLRNFQYAKEANPRFAFCKPSNLVSFVYKEILLEHIGETSTFQERNKKGFRPDFPKCGASMSNVWSAPREERFDILCNNSPTNMSPC